MLLLSSHNSDDETFFSDGDPAITITKLNLPHLAGA